MAGEIAAQFKFFYFRDMVDRAVIHYQNGIETTAIKWLHHWQKAPTKVVKNTSPFTVVVLISEAKIPLAVNPIVAFVRFPCTSYRVHVGVMPHKE